MDDCPYANCCGGLCYLTEEQNYHECSEHARLFNESAEASTALANKMAEDSK